MLRFWYFYRSTLLHTFVSLWTATDLYVKGIGIGVSILTFFSPELARLPWGELPTLSRWWAILPLLVLFAYGFLKALMERFEGIEQKIENIENRIATKDLLAEAACQGEGLGDILVDPQKRKDWVENTCEFIEAAFGKSEARRFITDDSSNMYRPNNPHALGVRLKRLDELIARANSLQIRPSFNSQDWENYFILE